MCSIIDSQVFVVYLISINTPLDHLILFREPLLIKNESITLSTDFIDAILTFDYVYLYLFHYYYLFLLVL